MCMAAIFVMWPNILYKFWLTYHKESSHEIWNQLGQWFVRKQYFENIDGTTIWATLAERAKFNPDLWNLFTAIVSLVLTYQVRIMTLALKVFKKSTFQKILTFKCIRKKLTLT